MLKPSSKRPASPQQKPYTPQATQAIKLLMDAWSCAADVGSEPDDFPVAVSKLREAGMPDHEIRWAVDKRYARVIFLPWSPNSGLALTDKGVEFFELLLCTSKMEQDNNVASASADRAVARPIWNHEARALIVADHVVKQFQRRAPNQELVIAAFEEDDWVRCIDDPLPPEDGQNPKRRLMRTIENLNKNMINPLIRFSGDGTGESVCWEYTDTSMSPLPGK